ncbi:hypothetical protein H5410_059266 [Solanum commersonii]|uniref:Uncharacterized protein n=1 Tax=Solanum commersonii TaxID=4109 RepID=A0A9J5W2F5_SOLCO|nr:hypothetical protein H5410_059266 [Solanum commersonii]
MRPLQKSIGQQNTKLCFLLLTSTYYELLEPYMDTLFELTTEGSDEDENVIALQAIELWSKVPKLDGLQCCERNRFGFVTHVPQPLEYKEDEDESYSLNGFTWESVVLGYSFGLVVRTVIWSLMFKYRKPKWVVELFDANVPRENRSAKEESSETKKGLHGRLMGPTCQWTVVLDGQMLISDHF